MAVEQDVLRRHRRRLLRRKDVYGVDIGLKQTSGQLLGVPAIRIHVLRKVSECEIPRRRILPKAIERVPVDVVESQFAACGCPRSSFPHRVAVNPIVGGCSIGRPNEDEFGTLGVIALDDGGSAGGISCAHVCDVEEVVVQPHRSGDALGVVSRSKYTALVDASFTHFEPNRQWKAELLGYGPIRSTTRDLQPVDLPAGVELIGACSGRTYGTVVAIDFSGWIRAPEGEKYVRDQMCIQASPGSVFARSGDSGCAIVQEDVLVGLLIAAGLEVRGGTGLATPMSRVLSSLELTLP